MISYWLSSTPMKQLPQIHHWFFEPICTASSQLKLSASFISSLAILLVWPPIINWSSSPHTGLNITSECIGQCHKFDYPHVSNGRVSTSRRCPFWGWIVSARARKKTNNRFPTAQNFPFWESVSILFSVSEERRPTYLRLNYTTA